LLPLPFDSMFNLLQCCCELSLQLHRMCLPCHVLLSTGQRSSRESLKAIVSLSLPSIRCIRHVTVVKKLMPTY
jgi:hypothetical protein